MAKIAIFCVVISSLFAVQETQEETVYGLTAQSPPISSALLQKLAHIGIDFTFGAPLRPNLETKAPVHWDGGVLFISDFNSKAEVFRKWLELAKFRPSKIVTIDDGAP